MHRSRTIAILGGFGAVASLALPFATFPDRSAIAGIEGSAWPIMLLLGPLMILMVGGDRREPPTQPVVWAAALLSIGGIAFAVVKLIDAWIAAADVSGSVGIGAWVLVAATLVAGAGVGLGLSRRI